MSDISSDPSGRGVTVSIKYGGGKEEPWAVFNGLPHEIRDDLITYFSIDPASAEDKPLAQLVLDCANRAVEMRATDLVLTRIGGTVIGQPASAQPDTGNDEAQAMDPWAAAEDVPAQPQAKPHQELYDTIASISDVDKLKLLWAENQDAFTADAELLDAWKARGKELSK